MLAAFLSQLYGGKLHTPRVAVCKWRVNSARDSHFLCRAKCSVAYEQVVVHSVLVKQRRISDLSRCMNQELLVSPVAGYDGNLRGSMEQKHSRKNSVLIVGDPFSMRY